jgi:probable rRNA maturation factor
VTARRRTGRARPVRAVTPLTVSLQGLARFPGLPARATMLRWVRMALLPEPLPPLPPAAPAARAPRRSRGVVVPITARPALAMAAADRAPAARVGPTAPAARILLRLVDGREGRRLNRTFRQRDYATNVLTFDYALAPPWADIVLCVPVIRREARARRRTLRDHLAHLVVHGMLHAQGHDHLDRAQARAMEALERALLKRLGIGDPYVVD